MPSIPNTMKAALLYGPLDVRVEKVPIPEIADDEVLIEVSTIGICPSDIKNYVRTDGKTWVPYGAGSYGLTGHEVAGIVVDKGSKVANLTIGDAVVPEVMIPCGQCKFCKKGLLNLCSNKEHLAHGYAQYLKAKAEYTYKIPKNVSMLEAAFTEPLAVVLHTNNIINPRPGDNVLIVGAGPMGILHTLITHMTGAKVIVSEINEKRLKEAKEIFGADVTINPKNTDIVKTIKETYGGVDAAIITIGNKEAIETSIKAAGAGATVAIFASAYPDIEISLNPNIIHWGELKITGSYEHYPYDMYRALEIMKDKRIDLSKLVSAKFNIDQIKDAFSYVMKGEGLKAQINFK